MERFEGTLPPTYFRNAFSVIFMYALNSPESINNIPSWAGCVSVQHIGDQGMKIVKALVGNKSDLEDERDVTESRAQETAEKSEINKSMVFEISAKTGDGVDEMFAAIARAFKGNENKSELSSGGGGTFPAKSQPEKKGCCS